MNGFAFYQQIKTVDPKVLFHYCLWRIAYKDYKFEVAQQGKFYISGW